MEEQKADKKERLENAILRYIEKNVEKPVSENSIEIIPALARELRLLLEND